MSNGDSYNLSNDTYDTDAVTSRFLVIVLQ